MRFTLGESVGLLFSFGNLSAWGKMALCRQRCRQTQHGSIPTGFVLSFPGQSLLPCLLINDRGPGFSCREHVNTHESTTQCQGCTSPLSAPTPLRRQPHLRGFSIISWVLGGPDGPSGDARGALLLVRQHRGLICWMGCSDVQTLPRGGMVGVSKLWKSPGV